MKILCAIDGSADSEETIRALAEHAWPAGTSIRVLTVAEKVHPSAVELVATGKSTDDAQHDLVVSCDVIAATAANTLKSFGIESDPVVREGSPKSAIVEEAASWGAKLIVVGYKGRSGVSRMLLGSVAQHVVAHAHCSVLVIRHTQTSHR
jgi:nucleotide-binding universal stress UspA family protein